MAEQVTLTTPVTFSPAPRTTWSLVRLEINVPRKRVEVRVISNVGEIVNAVYTTPPPPEHPTQPTGQQLLTTLNTANLTTLSLVKRALQRLRDDGYIEAGTVTGTPE